MTIDVAVELNSLRCIKEHDGSGHSEPYLWTAVIAGSDAGVDVQAPGVGAGARVVVKSGMRAGDQVQVPSAQRRFSHRFPDGVSRPIIGLVVALLEKDELPGSAVNAGYRRFLKEVEAEVKRYGQTHNALPTDEDIKSIAATIKKKVKTSVENDLSFGEKAKVVVGLLDLDDTLAFAARFESVDLLNSKRVVLEFKEETTVGGQPIEVSGSVVGHTPTTKVLRQHYELACTFTRAR